MTLNQYRIQETRRSFLGRASRGIGSLALASLINPNALLGAPSTAPSDKWAGLVSPLNFPARAKRVIYLYMAGGPSHLETFDFKPKLAVMSGKPMPDSFTKGQPIAQLQGQKLNCMAPQYEFKKFGKTGQEV